MKKARWLLAGLALAAVMALGAACDTGGTTGTGNGDRGGGIDTSGILELLSSPDAKALAGSLVSSLGQGGSSQQSGIWVTGLGEVTLEPDLALLSLGVETRAKTVEEARAEAARAMRGVIDALKARDIADRDIQTRYFNISPEYTYEEVYEGGRRYSKQVLVGYQVTSSVTARVRDMDALGVIIDQVVQAGGDAIRIQGISFTVEDSAAAQTRARELAVLDAMARAQQFATLTGAGLGNLLYIAESGGTVPRISDIATKDMAFGGAETLPTPINAGELKLQVYVQAVFATGGQ